MRVVKSTLKEAAHHETIDGAKRPKTDLEQWFFGPAVRQAAANFLMRIDVPPPRRRSGLVDPGGDLSYAICGLEAHIDRETGR